MPDVTLDAMDPFDNPQLAFVGVSVSCGSGESVIVALELIVHPLASVTVTV